jgi:hypothetical protein
MPVLPSARAVTPVVSVAQNPEADRLAPSECPNPESDEDGRDEQFERRRDGRRYLEIEREEESAQQDDR